MLTREQRVRTSSCFGPGAGTRSGRTSTWFAPVKTTLRDQPSKPCPDASILLHLAHFGHHVSQRRAPARIQLRERQPRRSELEPPLAQQLLQGGDAAVALYRRPHPVDRPLRRLVACPDAQEGPREDVRERRDEPVRAQPRRLQRE